MDPTNTPPAMEEPVPTTAQKRPTKDASSSNPLKKTPSRSGGQAAADYLQDQHRVCWMNHQPIGKRRYITVNVENMMNSLHSLYEAFFRINAQHFARPLETAAKTARIDAFDLSARVYLTCWLYDTYRTIRASVYKLDPIAFNDRYTQEVPQQSECYDNFLCYLNSSLRPTQILFNTAEEMYIPLLSADPLDWTKENPFPWTKQKYDYTVFLTVTQILDSKKLCPMTPLSNDPTGRPFWLFDWHTGSQQTQVFSWFPMENNFNFIDITAAYIIGVACSPKLGSCDRDEWISIDPSKVSPGDIRASSFDRTTSRIWRGNAEYRTVEVREDINYPNIREKDAEEFKKTNTAGPYYIRSGFSLPEDQAGSSSRTEMIPSSPRQRTRRSTAEERQALQKTVETGVLQARIIDFCYNGQIILRLDDTTRVAAFKKFIA
ncbi:ORF1 [Amaranthus cryptic virus 1]|nr:ORF1 [Amaranthus cryptic virus 1]